MFDLVIAGGTLVLPWGEEQADVGVCDGRIDRPAADRAAALDLGENSGECCVVSHSPGR
jgi:hypothetical protein